MPIKPIDPKDWPHRIPLNYGSVGGPTTPAATPSNMELVEKKMNELIKAVNKLTEGKSK